MAMSTSHAMSRADAAWLHMDRPTNLMIINSVLWFDEPIDWDAYTAVIRDRLVARFDRFRQQTWLIAAHRLVEHQAQRGARPSHSRARLPIVWLCARRVSMRIDENLALGEPEAKLQI